MIPWWAGAAAFIVGVWFGYIVCGLLFAASRRNHDDRDPDEWPYTDDDR